MDEHIDTLRRMLACVERDERLVSVHDEDERDAFEQLLASLLVRLVQRGDR